MPAQATKTAQLAQRLGVPAATVKQWQRAGIVTARKVPRPLRPVVKATTLARAR